MAAKDINTSVPGLDGKEILRELEVPFSPDQVQWRVTVTANDRKRGQIVPYADSRAYTDRLNVLTSCFSSYIQLGLPIGSFRDVKGDGET